MIDTPEVRAARQRADTAQHRMVGLLQELQQRVAPKTLARDAWDNAKSRGADLAEEAVDAVRARPLAATGAAAALGLFLAREPLMDLASKLWNRGKDKDNTPDTDRHQPNTSRARRARQNVED
ncbi:hypothetical protein H8M03_04390 [Sphingomonas sabuli]|uniref:DUF3618 domain-containing protein n=1 Tax=Sphingomonas sabuli TaxID=2764186 RepID=A0A7G9L4M3_9SPHN|nr:hypothetical protein [Sphingomonas sabuli]QNM83572.1 hypothetical protein H8M03_04390 [Sphingomonas sabuli]